MKKLLFVILSLFAFVAYADNTITSKEYVDGQVATLQTQIPAKNANTVLTNTGTAGTVGEKAIYDTTAAYDAQSDALVTAGAFNSAMQNALESEFVCTEWLGEVHDNAHCLLYEVRGATQLQTLPAGYTQLEYLEATGEQYIDTGVVGKSGISVEADVLATSLETYNMFLGTRNSGETRFFPIFTANSYWDPAVNTDSMGGSVDTDTKYHIRFVSSDTGVNFLVNGILTITHNKVNTTNTRTMYMFAGNNYGVNAQYQTHGRIYYMKIYSGDTLVRNFIPARRDSDGELGMYDLVNGTFFTNASTGEFVAGPVFSYLPQNQQ